MDENVLLNERNLYRALQSIPEAKKDKISKSSLLEYFKGTLNFDIWNELTFDYDNEDEIELEEFVKFILDKFFILF